MTVFNARGRTSEELSQSYPTLPGQEPAHPASQPRSEYISRYTLLRLALGALRLFLAASLALLSLGPRARRRPPAPRRP